MHYLFLMSALLFYGGAFGMIVPADAKEQSKGTGWRDESVLMAIAKNPNKPVNLDVISMLIKQKRLDVYEEDSQGHGLMWHAIVNGNSKIIPILAMHKARIDTDSRGNKTYPLATALEVVKAKMKDGSEPKAAIDYSDVIRNLLIVGCNPDEALENTESPIFTAIHHRYDHIFKILVDWGMADRHFSKPVIVVENYYPLCREITVIRFESIVMRMGILKE